MRSFYFLLVATAAFLASSDAMSPTPGSVQVQHPNVQGSHFLRNDKVDDEAEERTWATIGGIAHTEEEADAWMSYWLGILKSPKNVATELKIFAKNGADEHHNWAALVKYTRLHYNRITGQEMTEKEAKVLLRREILK